MCVGGGGRVCVCVCVRARAKCFVSLYFVNLHNFLVFCNSFCNSFSGFALCCISSIYSCILLSFISCLLTDENKVMNE